MAVGGVGRQGQTSSCGAASDQEKMRFNQFQYSDGFNRFQYSDQDKMGLIDFNIFLLKGNVSLWSCTF